jgi:hypothetical protein
MFFKRNLVMHAAVFVFSFWFSVSSMAQIGTNPESPNPVPSLVQQTVVNATATPASTKTDFEKDPIFIMRNVRYLAEIDWPKADLSSLVLKNLTLNQLLATTKEHCENTVLKYEKLTRTSLGITNFDNYFQIVCTSLIYDIKGHRSINNSEFLNLLANKIPAIVSSRLDVTYFNLFVSAPKPMLSLMSKIEKSHKTSPLGFIGVPLESSFFVTQILLLLSLLTNVVLVLKALL